MNRKEWALSIFLFVIISALMAGAGYAVNLGDSKLVTVKTDKVPSVDGQVDEVWQKAPEISIPVTGGRSGSTNVKMKAMYTGTHIYFLAQWEDSKEDLNRKPWKFDGQKWERLPGGGAYYEDKFSVYWNINDSTKGFNEKGCMITCHNQEGATKYGSHRTSANGELIDQWHWKAARTNPANQIDDQFVSWIKNGELALNGEVSKEAGRQADPKTSGGYVENIDKEKNIPIYNFKDPNNPLKNPNYIMKEEAVAITDLSQFEKGDTIPGHVVEAFKGDRADMTGKGVWENGKWTLEWSRELNTGSEFDVNFSDLNKEYAFGVATFNNEQWDHSYNLGVYKMVFE